MKPKVFTLDNGLTVVFIDTKAFPSLTTLLLVGAGSRFETKANNGVAHFFEHMAFKGSKKYPNSQVIASTIESQGGVFNAFTSKDHTGYWIKGLTEDFEVIIDVISDMVLNPLLDPEEIEREKGVIVEEINMYEDTPYRTVGDVFESMLYKGNPLGYEITGSKESVRSFTRKTFTDYIQSLYHPGNATLVVAGGLGYMKDVIPGKKDLSDNAYQYYLDMIEARFKDWKPGKKADFLTVTEMQTKPQIAVKHKKTEQAHFCLGFRAFSFLDKRRYALSLLSTILGGGMSSRLFIEVRERRGLCYYISSGRETYHDVGNFVTQAGVTVSLDKVKEAVKVVLAEHKKIADGDLSDQDLINAKELIKGRFILSMEDSQNVASYFGNKQLLEGKSELPAEVIEKIAAVTKEEVIAVAKEVFRPEKLNFAVIGPFKDSDFSIDDLKI